MKITEKMFGTHSQRELKRIEPIVNQIESMRPDMMTKSDEELRANTEKFKNEIKNGKSLDEILPEAFATVREAARRTLGMEHYRVQLIGGIILHQGRIAEMKTGEGKSVLTTEKIPTPDGWKKAGEIKVGDFLFDRRGNPTKVTGVYPQGKINTYKVTLFDGRVIYCSGEHLWSVYQESENKEKENKLHVYDTKTLCKKLDDAEGMPFSLPMNEPVQYKEKALSIDPYVMGCVLASEMESKTGDLQIDTVYGSVVNKVASILNCSEVQLSGSSNTTYSFCKNRKHSSFTLKVKEIAPEYTPLLTNTEIQDRYIPEEYKLASVEQRLALLQGLYDKAGYLHVDEVDSQWFKIEVKSEKLREDIAEIASSLGFKCLSYQERQDDQRQVVRIALTETTKKKLFTSPPKRSVAEKLVVPKHEKEDRVEIFDIKELNYDTEQVCFRVDNDEHLFLVGDYIVTHNTLVSTLPAYLNALTGEGVHIVTVNDYLAKRDAEWMGKVHEFLGLTVGCVLNSMKPDERRTAYNCDITYITNNEDGFDYLRDNMAIYKEQLVQRGLTYAIIDEVDSVLIDEARTPLIISGAGDKSTKLYEACDVLAGQLERGEASGEMNKMTALIGEAITETGDYIVNEKEKLVTLTEEGVKKVEKFFHIDNLSDAKNLEIQHNINLALRAHSLMHKDQDYVVKDDEILIVDEFTGRIMPGRRYSDGLHQAIEAKEHVKVKRESKTLATITFQNFFNKYKKKAGMTGTALTEEEEFREIYGMDVIEIPTNKPVQRKDLDDVVYMTKEEKFRAVVGEIILAHTKKQPVLVGTVTIETSEMLANMLRKAGFVQFSVLNAKYHEQEAEIVAKAGEAGAITIATNMAGRGTDIKLDDEARAAGGLKIIGTERHESRRIDNQLRGRSGRQGDPGESRFYLSLEDDLMRLFGSERLMNTFRNLGVRENEQIKHKMLTSAIKRAQEKIESNNYGIRKNLLDYDSVNNEQREIIYAERMRVLNGENMHDEIVHMTTDTIAHYVDSYASNDVSQSEWNVKLLNKELTDIIPIEPVIISDNNKTEDVKAEILKKAEALYSEKENALENPEDMREIERVVLLKVIDQKWMNHIDDMEQLRQGISLQAYGQRDPKIEYKMIAYDVFNQMTELIQEDTVKTLYHLTIERPEEEEKAMQREEVAKPLAINSTDGIKMITTTIRPKKIYPNDPCPCGSGKKFKKCHGQERSLA